MKKKDNPLDAPPAEAPTPVIEEAPKNLEPTRRLIINGVECDPATRLPLSVKE